MLHPLPPEPPGLDGPAAAPSPRDRRWYPIRSLGARHRNRILAHLRALGDDDRYLRFGYRASDAQVSRYVEQLDFARDEVLGVFDRRLALVAVAHLAFGDAVLMPTSFADGPAQPLAEFGVSVARHLRGRGIGAQLFEQAALHARNRGIERLVIHALSENEAMLALVRRAGAVVVKEGADATAVLRLPAHDLASHFHQTLTAQVAAIDYDLKRHARRLQHWRRSLREAPPPAAGAGGSVRVGPAHAEGACSLYPPADAGLGEDSLPRDAG